MYYEYMMTTKHNTALYTGVTNDLVRRVYEHKTGCVDGFTKRYHIHKLVYYEEYMYVYDAISREKQLKGWTREKKTQLIVSRNPTWTDLSEQFFG